MTTIGDLPHRKANGQWEPFAGLPQATLEGLSGMTAYTQESEFPRACHCCGKTVKTFACKPGSPYAWCLECF